ncbi:hypothetical protein QUV93_07230 [Phascolarctobacterium faecium]|nr:hypothetical protein [Phascolarctobacterium faecium]MDM8109660.1 hypothetical protein [Phascolarctobacterium faecium]
MSRTVAFIKNSASTALLQIITMFVGFFIPRIMIGVYGSEINGLISSIMQFIAYFNLVEAGISGAAVWALYKPLAEKNNKIVSSIIVATKNFYNKAGYIFVSLTLGLALIYPAFIKVSSLSFIEVFLLVLILGVSGALEFFTLAKYRALLTANQKTYIISLASVCAIILNAVIIFVLSYLKFNIVLVRFAALLSVFLRSIILHLYVVKKYPYIDYNVNGDSSKLNKHWDAMFLQLLGVVQTGGPIIMATLLTDLKTVSIYTVFNLVIGGINSILSIFISGLAASFGDVIARKEKDVLLKAYDEFEISYYTLITVIYSVAFIMIMPFIKLYTYSIADINYELPVLGFLMVLNGLLYNIKTPQGMMVISAGWYKETKLQTTIQALILVIIGTICGYYYGLTGIVIGSILSNIYRDIDLAFFIPKYLLNVSPKRTFFRILLVIILSVLLYLPFTFNALGVENIFEWCLYAILVMIYAIIVTVLIMFAFNSKTFKQIFKRIMGVIRNK